MAKADKIIKHVKIPDTNHLQHFNNALNVTNHIRKQQRLPALSIERFMLQATISAANEVMEWLAKQKQEANARAEGPGESAGSADNESV